MKRTGFREAYLESSGRSGSVRQRAAGTWHSAWEAFCSELRSVRIRVLATVLTFMAAGLFLSGAATHAVQLAGLNDNVNKELLRSSNGLRNRVQEGLNGTRAPYTSLPVLFNDFLSHDAAGGYASVAASVRGGNIYSPAGDQATKLCDNMEAFWAEYEPGRTVFRDMEIEGRTVRLALTSVTLGPDQPEGLLVASNEIG